MILFEELSYSVIPSQGRDDIKQKSEDLYLIYNKVDLHSFFVHDSRSHGYLWHTDGHGWTRITVRMLFFNSNRTNFTYIFGTRMDTDEHGFTVRMVAF